MTLRELFTMITFTIIVQEVSLLELGTLNLIHQLPAMITFTIIVQEVSLQEVGTLNSLHLFVTQTEEQTTFSNGMSALARASQTITNAPTRSGTSVSNDNQCTNTLWDERLKL